MIKWLKAFRLRTLPLALSSIVTGSFLAYSAGLFSWRIVVLAAITTIFLQILSNLANDFGDYASGVDNNMRVGPSRTLQSGEINKKQMTAGITILVVLSFISGIWLIYEGTKGLDMNYAFVFLALGIGAILAAIKYTVGKSPYGYIGLGDLSVFLFFGLTGVLGTYFLHTHSIHWHTFLPATSIGLLSVAVLNLNNMRDRENDANSGKRTLVVKMGIEYAKIYHTTLLLLAIVSSVVYTVLNYESPYQFIFIVIIPLIFSDFKIVWRHKNPASLDPELKKIALSTLLFSITFGLGLIIEHV